MGAKILVLNCFVKGWNILKRLADDGFEVNGADYRPGAPGLFSNRIANKSRNLIYPNPKTDETAFITAVLEHIQKEKFDIVLPVNAAEMMALAKHKTTIEKYAHFPFENYYKLLLLHDKKYFFELMSGSFDERFLPKSWSIGDMTPAITEIIKQAELSNIPYVPMENFRNASHFLNAYPGIIFPLIVKTRRSTSSVGVYRVYSADELTTACAQLNDEDIIIQENIDGRGVGISSIRWQNPDMLYHFGHKRVREFPISGGASTSREPWNVDKHQLSEKLGKFLDTLDWHGVVMFELKEGKEADGQNRYLFLEANPRFWGSVPLAMVNGVNFPVLLCRAALGMELPPVENKNRIRARIFFSDTLSMVLNVLKGRRIWYHLSDYFNLRRLFLDDIDMSDLPATRKIIGQMFSEFYARIIKRQ